MSARIVENSTKNILVYFNGSSVPCWYSEGRGLVTYDRCNSLPVGGYLETTVGKIHVQSYDGHGNYMVKFLN